MPASTVVRRGIGARDTGSSPASLSKSRPNHRRFCLYAGETGFFAEIAGLLDEMAMDLSHALKVTGLRGEEEGRRRMALADRFL